MIDNAEVQAVGEGAVEFREVGNLWKNQVKQKQNKITTVHFFALDSKAVKN